MNSAQPRSCLSEGELEQLVAGRLSPENEAIFKRHLEDCSSCQTRWSELREDEAIFKDLRVARKSPPDDPHTHTQASPARPLPTILAPDIAVSIEGYTITREIGRGGMGVVFEAIQQRLSRKVALKILPGSSGLRDRDALHRFRREATAAARLHHTNIVPVYDFGQSGHAHYYAMELVEGRSLTDMIRRLADANAPTASPAALDRLLRDATETEPPGSSATFNKSDSFSSAGAGSSAGSRTRAYYRHVARWMADAAGALHYAHDQGIIHRDIKPSNLLLARDGRIMILDFGLAKSQGDHSVTMTGAIVGTLRYMSPEQAMAKRMTVDHRTDIYSLGATMYELLTFLPAFSGHDDKETLGMIITRDPTAPRRINSTIPRELETICLKTLEKDPGARYATAKDLADDLGRFLQDLPIVAKPPGAVGRAFKYMRRRRAVTVAVLASILLLITVVVAVTYARWEKQATAARVQNLMSLIREHLNNQELDKVDMECDEVLALDPGNVAALVNKGTSKRYRYESTHDPKFLEEGVRLTDEAIAINPRMVPAWNLRGVLMRLANRLDEAQAAHEKGVEIDANSYYNWTSLANIFALKGNFARAEECLLQATRLETSAKECMPWYNLAAVQLHLRKPDARGTCERALQNCQRDAGSMLLWAKLLLTTPVRDDRTAAMDAAVTADSLMPPGRKAARVKRVRALAELRNERFKEAVANAQRAIELNDPLPFAFLISAISESRLGHPDAAQGYFLQAQAVWPRQATANAAHVDITGGPIWIDSMDDLLALRAEAEKVLGLPQSTQPAP